MNRSIIVAAVVLAAGTLAVPSRPALAGSPYYREPVHDDAVHDPDASGVPGVPNLQGCVRLCERDQSPCDPPVYKQADGRCNYMD